MATRVGLPGVLAHGMLTMGLAVETIVEWLGDSGRILEYGVRFTRPVVVDAESGATVHVVAKVGAVEETALRVDLTVDLQCPDHFAPDTPLSASKNYLDLKHAATAALPEGLHFTLIEAVADHICETLFLADERVLRVQVKIVKLAIAEAGESIGITLVRHRR